MHAGRHAGVLAGGRGAAAHSYTRPLLLTHHRLSSGRVCVCVQLHGATGTVRVHARTHACPQPTFFLGTAHSTVGV